jgi:hypothetical protein
MIRLKGYANLALYSCSITWAMGKVIVLLYLQDLLSQGAGGIYLI